MFFVYSLKKLTLKLIFFINAAGNTLQFIGGMKGGKSLPEKFKGLESQADREHFQL